jgi:hypothetical protein
MNWGFNVFPLLRPGLSNLYAKMTGLKDFDRRVTMTWPVSNDLRWARDYIKVSNGIHIIRERDWTVEDADFVGYTDACLTGLGFWIPESALGFYGLVPDTVPSEWIYYREALGIASTLHHAVDYVPRGSRIVIYTDNTNAQAMFNTLAVKPLYNSLVKFGVDLLIATDCNLRVLYVPSEENGVADALSRRDISRALALQLDLQIHPFTPPRAALGEEEL